MLRKGLAVAVILLFIGVAFIPNVSAYDKEINDDTTKPLDIVRTAISGFGLFPISWGGNVTFFALRCHIRIINLSSREIERYTIRFKWITISEDGINYFPVGIFRIFLYCFIGTLGDDFEPPDSIMRLNNQMRILS
jgi:hypothetical protein